jgi:hypothetical protein
MPFIGGINVFYNHFPANPTTWYIGTYLHLLLFWYFFLRGKEISKRDLLVAFLVENISRCTLIALEQNMVAYMLLPNWLTVFLLGGYLHKKQDRIWTQKIVWLSVIWVLTLALWSSSFNILSFDSSFPFRKILLDGMWEIPIRSLLISTFYLVSTLVVFEITRCFPLSRIISFFARNTLLIFIVHMPLIYAFSADIYTVIGTTLIDKVALIFILYVGIAIVSEFVQKSINIKFICGKCWKVIRSPD